jgi:hypothetical protein
MFPSFAELAAGIHTRYSQGVFQNYHLEGKFKIKITEEEVKVKEVVRKLYQIRSVLR